MLLNSNSHKDVPPAPQNVSMSTEIRYLILPFIVNQDLKPLMGPVFDMNDQSKAVWH